MKGCELLFFSPTSLPSSPLAPASPPPWARARSRTDPLSSNMYITEFILFSMRYVSYIIAGERLIELIPAHTKRVVKMVYKFVLYYIVDTGMDIKL